MGDNLEKAHSHRIKGEYQQAETLYRRVLQENANNAEACWGMGHTLMNRGDFDICVEYFEKAAKLDSENSRYLIDLAKFQAMLGEHEKARPLFNKVVELGQDERLVSEAKKQLSYF